jgi:hypothetical protein
VHDRHTQTHTRVGEVTRFHSRKIKSTCKMCTPHMDAYQCRAGKSRFTGSMRMDWLRELGSRRVWGDGRAGHRTHVGEGVKHCVQNRTETLTLIISVDD